jgi:hypothetical protein
MANTAGRRRSAYNCCWLPQERLATLQSIAPLTGRNGPRTAYLTDATENWGLRQVNFAECRQRQSMDNSGILASDFTDDDAMLCHLACNLDGCRVYHGPIESYTWCNWCGLAELSNCDGGKSGLVA